MKKILIFKLIIDTVKKIIAGFIKIEQEVRTLDRDDSKIDLFNEKLL